MSEEYHYTIMSFSEASKLVLNALKECGRPMRSREISTRVLPLVWRREERIRFPRPDLLLKKMCRLGMLESLPSAHAREPNYQILGAKKKPAGVRSAEPEGSARGVAGLVEKQAKRERLTNQEEHDRSRLIGRLYLASMGASVGGRQFDAQTIEQAINEIKMLRVQVGYYSKIPDGCIPVDLLDLAGAASP